jgi:hypothetical protein
VSDCLTVSIPAGFPSWSKLELKLSNSQTQ